MKFIFLAAPSTFGLSYFGLGQPNQPFDVLKQNYTVTVGSSWRKQTVRMWGC